MTPRDKWNDERIDDLARQYREDLGEVRDEVRTLRAEMNTFSAGRRLTTAQILALLSGFLGPIMVAIIAGLFLVMTKGTP